MPKVRPFGHVTEQSLSLADAAAHLGWSRRTLIRALATGAQTVAYTDAQKFCAQKGDGSHPIVVNTQERDIYQSSFGGGFNQYGGGVGGSTMAAGAVNFRFRCGQ